MLNWDWKDKVGKCTLQEMGETYALDIYSCNGLFVIVYNFTRDNEERYQVVSFAVDLQHFKRCLKSGTYKGYQDFELESTWEDSKKVAKALNDFGFDVLMKGKKTN